MSNNINLTVDQLNSMKATDIVRDEHVRDKFIQIYDTMWAGTVGTTGSAAYERESRAFNRLLSEKEDLRTRCSHFSIFTSFLDIAISGLSVEPGARAQSYLMSRSVNVGRDEKGQNIYQTQCVLTISGYGELVLRTRCGQIRHADNPVIVYAEDSFEYGERNNQKFVNYVCHLPHTSGQIVAAFMKITRNDGTYDYAVLLPEDWNRLAGYSARQNRHWDRATSQWVNGAPNALYGGRDGQIDTGFLTAKLIKHAFKTYPKARIGRGTQLESQREEEQQLPEDIYSLGDGTVVDKTSGEVVQGPDHFGPDADTSAGVVVNPDNSTNRYAAQAAVDDDEVF